MTPEAEKEFKATDMEFELSLCPVCRQPIRVCLEREPFSLLHKMYLICGCRKTGSHRISLCFNDCEEFKKKFSYIRGIPQARKVMIDDVKVLIGVVENELPDFVLSNIQRYQTKMEEDHVKMDNTGTV